ATPPSDRTASHPIKANGARAAQVSTPTTPKEAAVTYSCSQGDHVQTPSRASNLSPCSEMWLTPSSTFGIPNFKTFRARFAVSASSPHINRPSKLQNAKKRNNAANPKYTDATPMTRGRRALLLSIFIHKARPWLTACAL